MPDTSVPPLTQIETTIEATREALPGIYRAMESFWRAVDRVAWVASRLPDRRWRVQFDTAVWEISTNIVRHGHPPEAGITGHVALRLSLYHYRVEAHFRDRGLRWSESKPEPQRVYTPDDILTLPESGLGLGLAHSILDTLSYRRTDDGENHWHLVKLLNGGQTTRTSDRPR